MDEVAGHRRWRMRVLVSYGWKMGGTAGIAELVGTP
jgi:hypothetical protein